MNGRKWEVGDVAAILANPFYAVGIHKSFSHPHEHVMSESTWIASNSRAIDKLSPGVWLGKLLAVLQEERTADALVHPLAVADPYPAITVHRTLCEEHEPIIETGDWIAANARGLEEEGEVWLRNLVSVLRGSYP